MAFSLRPASQIHIPIIQSLSEEIWREYYPSLISLEQIEYMLVMMYSVVTLRKELQEGKVYKIACWGDRNIGYLSYHQDVPGQLKLSKLYLLKEFRGQGFGNRMLQRVVDAAPGYGASEVYLCVNKGNSPAIAMYERFGFMRAEAVVTEIGGGFVMDDWVYRLIRHLK
jgi:ribosomal protein S18 acetylase RimI-like enzyme